MKAEEIGLSGNLLPGIGIGRFASYARTIVLPALLALPSLALLAYALAITSTLPGTLIAAAGVGAFAAAATALGARGLGNLGLERERRSRRKLEETCRGLLAAQSVSKIGSWDWDLSEGPMRWSEEMYRITGVTQGRFKATPENFFKLFHDADRQRIQETVESSIAAGQDFRCEGRLVALDDAIKSVELRGQLLREGEEAGRMVGTLQDISGRRSIEKQVEFQAFHDSLTGLANRSLFLDRLEHALVRRERQTAPIALLFIDLDDFKPVNDSLGHRAGDVLLIGVAQRIQTVVRSIDTVSRLGGDEFAVLLEDVQADHEATDVAQRVLEILRQPFFVEGTTVSIHASIGVTLVAQSDHKTASEILRDSDTAMYVTKKRGKNGFTVFEQHMQDAARERLQLRADLQKAIDDFEFVVEYQPIVSLETGDIQSVEALVRWDSPTRGWVPPLDFISFAESTGQIISISRLVLVEACYKAAEWQAIRPMKVAVNISAVAFRESRFIDDVKAILSSSGLPPRQLTLELTESVLVEDDEIFKERLMELKALGVNLAIDDFGTGYSSLSYLRQFPIDTIKIDKTFIDSLDLSPEDSALARAIIKLGRTLDMRVVAEGVETAKQVTILKSLACDYAQGRHFSGSKSPAHIRALIESLPAIEPVYRI